MARYYGDSDAITYPQLIFQQIKTIQNVTSKELRDSSKIIKNLVGEQTIEQEDTRYSYLQSVETLGSLLSPYFGNNKKEKESISSKFRDFCDLYDMQLVEAFKDEDFMQELKKFFDVKKNEDITNNEKKRNEANVYFLNSKIQLARKMFRDLVQLFKDNDYLAQESYSEGSGAVDNGMDALGDDDE